MLQLNVMSAAPFAVITGDGAIGDLLDYNTGLPLFSGIVFATKATAAALTLRAPKSGNPDGGGEDGRVLQVIAATAAGHAIKTPNYTINGNGSNAGDDTATLSGAIGDSAVFIAYGGIWYVQRDDHNSLTEA